jgi:hypothetical protein
LFLVYRENKNRERNTKKIICDSLKSMVYLISDIYKEEGKRDKE